MSYKIITIPPFDKQLKRLSKKYKSIGNDLRILAKSIEENPIQGTYLGNDCYKIRMKISSKNIGKSGGARIITHLIIKTGSVYFISIYDKSELPSISENEITALLKFI